MEIYYSLKQRRGWRQKHRNQIVFLVPFLFFSFLPLPSLPVSSFCSVGDEEAQMGNSRYLITSNWMGLGASCVCPNPTKLTLLGVATVGSVSSPPHWACSGDRAHTHTFSHTQTNMMGSKGEVVNGWRKHLAYKLWIMTLALPLSYFFCLSSPLSSPQPISLGLEDITRSAERGEWDKSYCQFLDWDSREIIILW